MNKVIYQSKTNISKQKIKKQYNCIKCKEPKRQKYKQMET